MPLLCHGVRSAMFSPATFFLRIDSRLCSIVWQESTDAQVDIFDREAEWVDKVLRPLVSFRAPHPAIRQRVAYSPSLPTPLTQSLPANPSWVRLVGQQGEATGVKGAERRDRLVRAGQGRTSEAVTCGPGGCLAGSLRCPAAVMARAACRRI
jgi:hypothetical protein